MNNKYINCIIYIINPLYLQKQEANTKWINSSKF